MKEHLYIHGAYFESNSGESFETKNPANGKVIASVDQASEDDVEKAIKSAEQGFITWSSMTAVERGQNSFESGYYSS